MPLAGRRDSYANLRDTLRWRVALVLGLLMTALMATLFLLNTHLGYPDTARLAAWICGASTLSLAMLWLLPKRQAGLAYFGVIAAMLALVPIFGLANDRPLHYWGYLFPAMAIFLWPPGWALAAMLGYGVYVAAFSLPLLSTIELVRFASVYGLLVCFLHTYALLERSAASMLRFHSDHDALTNCLNRRTFNETLADLARRPGHGVFLLIDIDHFKPINDQHGHLVGDRVITETAAVIGRALGPEAPLFRYGGEEFAVVLAGASEAAGAATAEEVRAAVEAADFHGVRVTVSIGVAAWRSGRIDVAQALDAADRALYEAKRGGRNRVAAGRGDSDVGKAA